MSHPTKPRLREVLDSASALDLSMEDIASNIEAMSWMHFLLLPDPQGDRTPFGEEDEDENLRPRAFTDFEALHDRAVQHPEILADRSYETHSEPWLIGLLRLWEEGAPGLVLDAGDGVSIDLDRGNLRALIMAFTVEWFVSPSDLCVVMRQGRVYYHVNAAGQRLAFAFTTRGSAFENLARMRRQVPSLVVAPVDPSLLLEGTLGAGVERLVLDPGMPEERSFSRENLETLRELRLGCEADAAAAATVDSFRPDEDGEADPYPVPEPSAEARAESEPQPAAPEPAEAADFELDSLAAPVAPPAEAPIDERMEEVVQAVVEQHAEDLARNPVPAPEATIAEAEPTVELGPSDDSSAFHSFMLGEVELDPRVEAEAIRIEEESQASSEMNAGDFFEAILPSQDEIEAGPEPTKRPAEPKSAAFQPRRSAREAHAHLLEIKALAEADGGNAWLVTECLANEIDLWVPRSATSEPGRPWPHVETVVGAKGCEVLRATAYTSEEEAQASFAKTGESHELLPMAGLEAFRWLWSTPNDVVEIRLDPLGEGGGFDLHRNSIPAMLFPSILGVRDLSMVREVAFEGLGRMRGAHGLKPEVVRAFAKDWSKLVGPPADGSQAPIEFGGGRYLPVFSDTDHIRSFLRDSGVRLVAPKSSASGPPYELWLRLARGCDGIVLNPVSDPDCASECLTLDSVELFHLQLWAQDMTPPEGMSVASALFALQQGDLALDQAACGRIAADWPLYLAGKVQDGNNPGLVEVPGTDDLALFTGERELAEFKRTYRAQGVKTDSIEAHHMLPRWRSSFFTLANEHYSGLCINPGSSASAYGVRLDGKGLDGAIERLEERLRPRVAGFFVAP